MIEKLKAIAAKRTSDLHKCLYLANNIPLNDNGFVFAFANCADELIAVVEAAQKTLGLNCINGKHALDGCFACQLAITIQALHTKIKTEIAGE